MNRSLVLLVLVCLSDFVAATQCDLEVSGSWFTRFSRKLKKWYTYLKNAVTRSDEPSCKVCDLIRPPGQKSVDSEKDPRIGCRCDIANASKDIMQCACCFKIKNWDYLICTALGFDSGEKVVFFLLSVGNYVIVHYNVSTEGLEEDLEDLDLTSRLSAGKISDKLFECIPMPAPITFLTACFRPKFERPSANNNQKWKFCGELKIRLLQITIATMDMRCFEVTISFDGIKITGQTHPTVDIANPVTAEVNEKSYNSAVCLCNTKKQNALDGNSSRPTVEIFARTNWKESKSGETPAYLAVLHQKDPISTDKLTGYDRFPQIHAVLKRTQSEKWLNESESSNYEQDAKFCGGALLTSNKVLTVCACIRTFYIVNKLKKSPHEEEVYPFDLQAVNIYVDITGNTFTYDEFYSLDKDPDNFMTKSLCARIIEQQEADRRIFRDHQHYGNATWSLQTAMMVMAFKPEITDPRPGQFVRWPPRLVHAGQEVDMVAFGMERSNSSWFFRDSSGRMINFQAQAVRFFFKQCPMTNYSKEPFLDQLVSDVHGRVSGFCSRQLNSQLCYGKIGFPLVSGNELLGMSSLPVDCEDEGSIAGAIFDPVTLSDIESFLNTSTLTCLPHILLLVSIMIAFLQLF